MLENIRASAIVVAAGKGKRMGAECNKQFIKLSNKPILAHTLEVLQNNTQIEDVILVVGAEETDFCVDDIVNRYGLSKVRRVVAGGEERQDSVAKGLQELKKDCRIVLVQDGARPFIKNEMIEESIRAAWEEGAAIIAVPVKDTIKQANANLFVEATLQRSSLWSVQTPQAFKKEILLEAYTKLRENNMVVTDDAAAVEHMGQKIKIIMGSYENLKITTPIDLLIAEEILKRGGL